MANNDPSPETRFGAERGNTRSQDDPLANKPWSIRGSQKYFAAMQMEYARIRQLSEDDLLAEMLEDRKKVTLAQVGAARQIIRFAKELADASIVTDNVDGKQANTNLNADFAQVKNMTSEQINDALDRFFQRRHSERGCGDGDDTGTGEPSGSGTPTGGEA